LIPAKPETLFFSFNERAGSLTGKSPIVSCEKECLGASDESIYEWVRVSRLFVANSRHLVLARIKTPKNSYKTPESAVSCTLQMAGFRISKSRCVRFFTHPTKKNALSFPVFCQKVSLQSLMATEAKTKDSRKTGKVIAKNQTDTVTAGHGNIGKQSLRIV